MSNIAIVRTVDFEPDECRKLSDQLEEIQTDTRFIVTNGEANVLSKEEFGEMLQQYAEAAGYDLVER